MGRHDWQRSLNRFMALKLTCHLPHIAHLLTHVPGSAGPVMLAATLRFFVPQDGGVRSYARIAEDAE